VANSNTSKSASDNSSVNSGRAGASSMAELMAKMGGGVKPLQRGDIVEGTIKKLTSKEILVEIGGKGDALAIEYDKNNMENLLNLLHVGDQVKASVISPESEEGFPVVSLRRMLDDLIFSKFEELSKNATSFDVFISEVTRGGYFAEIGFSVKGFLPNSQITGDENLVGKTVPVKIIEYDRAKKRIILSQKAVAFVIDPAVIEKYVKPGDTVKAIINSVSSYGFFVTIQPRENVQIEGFVHISEVSHERVENLQSLHKKGDTITAQVLELDREARRVNLSLKALAKDAFSEVKEKYKAEQKVSGTVKDVKNKGITLNLEDGINAFIPADKIPTDIQYSVGQKVEAEVVDIDPKRRVVIISPVLKKTFVGYR